MAQGIRQASSPSSKCGKDDGKDGADCTATKHILPEVKCVSIFILESKIFCTCTHTHTHTHTHTTQHTLTDVVLVLNAKAVCGLIDRNTTLYLHNVLVELAAHVVKV